MPDPVACNATPFDIRRLDYDLPPELIAQAPADNREDARLLVVGREADVFRDARVRDLPALLRGGDLLVLNDTRVLPARFHLRRESGGRMEGLFLEDRGNGKWTVMLKNAQRCRPGEYLTFFPPPTPASRVHLEHKHANGQWDIRVEPTADAAKVLDAVGMAPLPPYIRRLASDDARTTEADRRRYQTVYARNPGAVAAPTAGLHLTEELLTAVGQRGIETAFVTLHVGPGTFKPVTVECLSQHRIHAERFDLPVATAAAVDACRERGGRVIAVGTTTVRVLEHCALPGRRVAPGAGSTRMFIYPPYTPRVVDGLLTNFHLPRSTLLALVMAFAGVERIERAYAHAVAAGYRLYSYGDATLMM